MSSFELDNLGYLPAAICIPFAIIGNIKLFRLRNEMFMKKRAISTTFGINGSLILVMLAICTTRISVLHLTGAVLSICIAFLFIGWWLLLFFLNTRNWMIYFKYKWQYYQLQLEWQQLINSNIVEYKNANNWYISKASTYGNLHFVSKLFGVGHLIGCMLCIAGTLIRIHALNHLYYAIIGLALIGISLIPTVIFYVIIVCKTPSFNDLFHIHYESKMQAKVSILIAVVFVSGNIILYSTGNNIKITTLFAVTLLTLVFFAMNFVSTFLLIYKQSNIASNATEKHIKLEMQSSNKINLEQILSNKKAMHLFMVHLSKEYSIECLLSYIEFTQYKQYLIIEMQKLDVDGDGDDGFPDIYQIVKTPTKDNSSYHQRFPSNIPQSAIVSKDHSTQVSNDNKQKHIVTITEQDEEQDEDVDEEDQKDSVDIYSAKIKAHELYNKYIKIGSEYEINISGGSRKRLKESLENKEVLIRFDFVKLIDLFTIFDGAKDDMMRLLQYSWQRYKLSPEYRELLSVFSTSTRLIIGGTPRSPTPS